MSCLAGWLATVCFCLSNTFYVSCWRPTCTSSCHLRRSRIVFIFSTFTLIFTRDSGSAVLAVGWRLCVCVCVSVTRRYCVKTAERIQLVFGTWSFLDLPYSVLGSSKTYKITVGLLSSGTFARTLDFKKCYCSRRSLLSVVNSQSTTVASVSLIVHLCLQHDGRDAARRADQSASLRLVGV